MSTFFSVRVDVKRSMSVSYTHLDVYKRQMYVCVCVRRFVVEDRKKGRFSLASTLGLVLQVSWRF